MITYTYIYSSFCNGPQMDSILCVAAAGHYLRAAAAANGRSVPEHLLKAADLAVKDELEEEVEEKRGRGGSFMDLFRPNKMALRTLNMCFQWFSATM